ncbi:protein of unknown function [Magnetospirillum sp. XM-1]|uniref:VVA0879 family protein n=1 Tax=Magnetospirillum sp. XM-1 TaxID=1663591 RepID=UPI00073DE46E|nr:VVA0879 family protein [Magnetospirillum sp. XM-1]CUW41659.1 protein of unknown function [Magnetospirillum sp. XM-1]
MDTPSQRALSRRDCPQTRRVSYAQFQGELAAQGMPNSNHYAFKCPSCGHVQSMASMVALSKVPTDKVDGYVYFSCEGRFNAARGCDWTLGGLLKIHALEVETGDGIVPAFEPASPEEAADLLAEVEGMNVTTVTMTTTVTMKKTRAMGTTQAQAANAVRTLDDASAEGAAR